MATNKKAAPKKAANKKKSAPKKAAVKKSAPKKVATKKNAKPAKEMSESVKKKVLEATKKFVGKPNDGKTQKQVTKATTDALADGAPKEKKPRALRGQMEIATYSNFDQLNGKTLKPGNTVIFEEGGKAISFTVTADGLEAHSKDKGADALLKRLGINGTRAARKCYSYDRRNLGSTDFPTVKIGDMSSLTRLVLVLFLFNEGAEAVDLKMFNRHWKHITPEMIGINEPAAEELEA